MNNESTNINIDQDGGLQVTRTSFKLHLTKCFKGTSFEGKLSQGTKSDGTDIILPIY